MTFNIAGDYAIWDGGETVTLRQLRADGSVSSTVDNASSGVVSQTRGNYQGIEITGDERSWSLNSTQVGARGVIVDDIIEDAAGNTWRVLSSEQRTLDTRWYCVCRKQV